MLDDAGPSVHVMGLRASVSSVWSGETLRELNKINRSRKLLVCQEGAVPSRIWPRICTSVNMIILLGFLVSAHSFSRYVSFTDTV